MKKKFKLKMIDKPAVTLLVVGGINWGLDTLGFNLVDWLASITYTVVGTIIYSLVSLSAVYVGVRFLMGKIKFVK